MNVMTGAASAMMTDLLKRLDGVRARRSGGWVAKCPCPLHEHGDRHPSLAIARAADRWLIHCYAGCYPIDIVRALGLELADLFDDRQYRARGDQERPRLSIAERFEIIQHEIGVAFFIIADFHATKVVNDHDYRRLATALRRIGSARYA